MDKKKLIRTIEALPENVTREGILEIVNELIEQDPEHLIGMILIQFMCDDNTLFNIEDVNRILKTVLLKIIANRQ